MTGDAGRESEAMTARKRPSEGTPEIENLDLSKETVRELTESGAEAVAGGRRALIGTRGTCQSYGECIPTAASPGAKGRPGRRDA